MLLTLGDSIFFFSWLFVRFKRHAYMPCSTFPSLTCRLTLHFLIFCKNVAGKVPVLYITERQIWLPDCEVETSCLLEPFRARSLYFRVG